MSLVETVPAYAVEDVKSKSEESSSIPPLPSDQLDRSVVRPPIDYSSVDAFFRSSWRRFLSLWTRRFVLSLLAGQVVSLCITCTNVTNEELNLRNWQLPITQTFFLEVAHTHLIDGFNGWFKMLYKDSWKYIILAACDVEGNFLVVKAYQYTTLLSCMLLDAWAIPVCMFFLYGVFICVTGLGLLVVSDHLPNKDWVAVSKGKGDAFMILGATLCGFTNATEEFFVRRSPLYEVVGQLGMWGTIINGVQASIIEHNKMKTATWSHRNIALLFAYTAAMYILYTVAPLLYRLASSAYFNLSLLSSDFYGLLFDLVEHFQPHWLYFPSSTVVLQGLVFYFWHSTRKYLAMLSLAPPHDI
ncbi:hypothetical protein F5148DRAFT_1273883 [Russula earlei]|uniref:Uncharacterized protein n=1 Tax=Russula earlei TaxID=71964 RepID=A0ACC0UL39_9AGAM|nr:hypothetical protein F5148DRAFT_1273883 [Russula earlei]